MKDDTFEKIAAEFAEKWAKRTGEGASVETHACMLVPLLVNAFRMGREEQRVQTIERLKELVP